MSDSSFGEMVPAEDIADLLDRRRRAKGLTWAEVARRAELAESRISDQLNRGGSHRLAPEVTHKVSKPLALDGNTLLVAIWGMGEDATNAMGKLLKLVPHEDKPTRRGRRRGNAGLQPAGSGPRADATAPQRPNPPRSPHWDRVLDAAKRIDKAAWGVCGQLYADGAEVTADADGTLRIVAGLIDAAAYDAFRKKAMLPIRGILEQILLEARADVR
jgi:hypothetical protein